MDESNIINSENATKIKEMIASFKKESHMELEFGFKSINQTNFMRISKYYVDNTPDLDNNVTETNSLDITVELENGNIFRTSLFDENEIDLFQKRFSKSRKSDILEYLAGLKSSDSVELMYKNRNSGDRLYIDEWGVVFKLTSEIPINVKNKPNFKNAGNILYRYKNRYSFQSDNFRVDITNVQQSNNLQKLVNITPIYELEVEATSQKITYKQLVEKLIETLKIVQDTPIPIKKSESISVIDAYRSIITKSPKNSLDSRNPISLEIQHILNFIPNKYAITDKADGERYFLFIDATGQIYLLSNNLIVKKMDKIISDKKFWNTILDGELIMLEKTKLFMAFDVIYSQKVDFRFDGKYNLTHRINVLNTIIDKCFGNLVQFENYTDKHNDINQENIKKFYTKELKNYWNSFKKIIKGDFVVTRKLYFVPFGIDSSEVFMYADLIWKSYVYGALTPYTLDGIIYTPINSPYSIKVDRNDYDSVAMEYKWKPPFLNTIDFYIEFQLDATGSEAVYYDNNVIDGKGRPYKIAQLYVGLIRDDVEKPIPFKVNGAEQKSIIYLSDDAARDKEGNIINNFTVVEFTYDNNLVDVADYSRWIAEKTRYDKTESVQKYQKRYGNPVNIANRIWKTIINPVTEEIISSLGDQNTYTKSFERLGKLIKSDTPLYYQKITTDAIGMRAFNNWIKTNLISTYCQNKNNVLDIGCGRGGDLIKFIHAQIGEYVGVDIDNNGLYIINDSAYNRYKNLKKNNRSVPPMYFINADAKALFNIRSQKAALPSMSDTNEKLIKTHLTGKKYDIINCQFSLHYYLSDNLSWDNFCTNINDHLKDNGYFLITCFDGQLIHDKLNNRQKLSASYTNNNGTKDIFFEIVKMYEDKNIADGIGIGIDFYNSLISKSGTYIKEYLVFPDFLEKSLKEKCGLELVESDSFFNLFTLYKNYFMDDKNTVKSYLGSPQINNKRYEEIREFYQALFKEGDPNINNDAVMASFKLSMLNRYYVFKKTALMNFTEPSRVVGINHRLDLGPIMGPYFTKFKLFVDMGNKTNNPTKIYNSVKKKYGLSPSAYIVRHQDNIIGNGEYHLTDINLIKVKDGDSDKILLIYKSPEKIFHPIYYQTDNFSKTFDLPDKMDLYKITKSYLLDSDAIIDDFDIIIEIHNKLSENSDDAF